MKVWYTYVTSVIIKQHKREILNYTNNLNMKESSILVMNGSIRQDFSQLLKHTNSLNMKESSILVMNVTNRHQHR